MAIRFGDVMQLENAAIREGERWLYSADFNISYSDEGGVRRPRNTERVDSELEDMRHIADNGGVVAILAHQGRYRSGNAVDLDFIARYLGSRTGREVKYCKENNTGNAAGFVESLKPGEIAIMGNTRFHEGEEANDPVLAGQFAGLAGNGCAAIGGFGKAHRKHASNAGILQHIPGYITASQVREMELLEPWAGVSEEYSVAVLGGLKKEKITEGLAGFARNYDAIIPGGIVLNTIYLAQGKSIGKSVIEDAGKRYDKMVGGILESEFVGKLCIPEEVVIAKPVIGGYEGGRRVAIVDGVPDDFMIADVILPDKAVRALERLASGGGRLVLAGLPGIYASGFTGSTDAIAEYMNREEVKSAALGGDTASLLKFRGYASTGGGSALHFIAHGTTPVFEALRENKARFA
ncbi:MAG: phosphoglycerate kinase [Candidatus Aenigmarchaeota archaeon]|nr:phosphoglycerate kinase [Candidatus Aenigmarchaeota archaeon]